MDADTEPMNDAESLRSLPSVERLASRLPQAPHPLAVAAARETIDAVRQAMLGGGPVLSEKELAVAATERLARLTQPSLRRVINATGVVLHTNLGRAPLAPAAVAQLTEVAGGYSNLEYDLGSGARGSRGAPVEALLRQLSGAEDAIAVNNNAAAVRRARAARAGGGGGLVGGGELVETGGSSPTPDPPPPPGPPLVGGGTTTPPRLADYAAAIGERTTAIL